MNIETYYILSLIGIFISSIVFHEFGHFFYLNRIGKPFKFKIDMSKDIKFISNLNDLTYFKTLLSGISLGLVPILIGAYFLDELYIILVLPYTFGCWFDIKKLVDTAVKMGWVE